MIKDLSDENYEVLENHTVPIHKGHGASRFKITDELIQQLKEGKVILVDSNAGEYVTALYYL